jgi:hypothetical protein
LQKEDEMNFPPTYRHDYDYEPPRPGPVYDTPRIVERRPVLGAARAALRRWLA